MAEAEDRVVSSQPAGGPTNVEASAEDLLEQLRRERADFLNYKRRGEGERAEDIERARADVLRTLLPVLDEMDRAMSQAPPDLKNHPWVQGIALVHRMWMDALKELGVERIGKEGEPFDPERHEALFYDVKPDAQDQRVSSVIRHGYVMHGRLLRPAQVGVVGPPTGAVKEGTVEAVIPPESDSEIQLEAHGTAAPDVGDREPKS